MFFGQFSSLRQAHNEFSQLDNQQLAQDPYVVALTFPDQCEFLRLSAFFRFASDRNKRNLAISTFTKHLQMIRAFVMRGDYMDIDRGIAAGIQFGPDYMLVNTKRLKLFMGRSKSCINGCFQKMGYAFTRIGSDDNEILNDFQTRMHRQLPLPRQWCIRSLKQSEGTAETSSDEIEIDSQSSETSMSIPEFFDVKSLLNRRAESI